MSVFLIKYFNVNLECNKVVLEEFRKVTHKVGPMRMMNLPKKLVQFSNLLKVRYNEREVVMLLLPCWWEHIWTVVFIHEGCSFGGGGENPALGEDLKPC